MNIRLFVAFLILLLAVPAQGQQRRAAKAQRAKKTQRVQKITLEEQMRQEKLERMKSAMQKVMIIDSMVVDKEHFLQYYKLSPETGSISDGDEFFHIKEHDGYFVHINEIGNKCYYSQQVTDSTSNLFFRESANTEWSNPTPLVGINDDHQFRHVNYPYMMGDGTTFYFAADGDEEGLGGYDIYMTTYDEEDNRFLRPVNIGLPFNSAANDYLYVIDEYANLGWFASDRNQEEGKVCIYIFVPSEMRLTYNIDDYTPVEIKSTVWHKSAASPIRGTTKSNTAWPSIAWKISGRASTTRTIPRISGLSSMTTSHITRFPTSNCLRTSCATSNSCVCAIDRTRSTSRSKGLVWSMPCQVRKYRGTCARVSSLTSKRC